jgi:predicted transcriptional regulator
MATLTARQSIKVSERTGKLLRVLAALDDSSQAEIADKAIAQYVEDRKKALRGRLGEVQKLLDSGGERAVSRAWGKKVASRR